MKEVLKHKYAIVCPVANEGDNIILFAKTILQVIRDSELNASVFFVADKASTDNTVSLLRKISLKHHSINLLYVPTNKNVVDAYLAGFRQAVKDKYNGVVEIDAGFSHDPKQIPQFVQALESGYDCAFGVRPLWNLNYHVPLSRRLYSIFGTLASNLLLGTKLPDSTSGFEAFRSDILSKLILAKPLLSTGHFYQTEIRYLCRNTKLTTIPITYQFPSARVNKKSIRNALSSLIRLFLSRVHVNIPV